MALPHLPSGVCCFAPCLLAWPRLLLLINSDYQWGRGRNVWGGIHALATLVVALGEVGKLCWTEGEWRAGSDGNAASGKAAGEHPKKETSQTSVHAQKTEK